MADFRKYLPFSFMHTVKVEKILITKYGYHGNQPVMAVFLHVFLPLLAFWEWRWKNQKSTQRTGAMEKANDIFILFFYSCKSKKNYVKKKIEKELEIKYVYRKVFFQSKIFREVAFPMMSHHWFKITNDKKT